MAFDFSGWATRNDLKCSDGRTIRKDAFKDNDGQTVPLVWQHIHNDPMNVLGHCLLENTDEGVYTYGTFNDTEAAKHAKELVQNGDITALSIYANHLTQKGGDVLHGAIREVSLVLTGANPGAFIDVPVMAHSGEPCEDEAIIYTGEELCLEHADKEEKADDEETVQDVMDSLTEKQRQVVYALISEALHSNDTEKEIEHSDSEEEEEKDYASIYNDMNDDQKEMVQFLVGEALADGEEPEVEETVEADVEHSDSEEEEDLEHADSEETIEDIYNSFNEDQKTLLHYLIGKAIEDKKNGSSVSHADDVEEVGEAEGPTMQEIYETLTDKQKDVVNYLVGKALEDEEEAESEEKEEVEHSEGGNTNMKKNVFENTEYTATELRHAAFSEIVKDAKKMGSLKEAFLAHADDDNLTDLGYTVDAETGEPTPSYGIGNTDYLFPDARTLNGTPIFVQRDMDWVEKVMNGVHRSPFSRIKSIFANITEDEARAKGYTKGNLKKEEIFGLLKRTTTPTTVYKKQKLDRDDVIDITDFDVIAWLKAEMRMMLDEELARAFLIGDGRDLSSDDKISELNIRPIYTDADFFTIKAAVKVADKTDEDEVAKKFIRTAIKARKDYKGSGSPTLYTNEDMLTSMLLLEDAIGHKLYKTEGELATALRVKEIVTVPVFDGVTREDADHVTRDLAGIIVNLVDYNVGADKGGAVNMFDDFDIDYNQMKYLIETRCSGALIKPYSAIALEIEETAGDDSSN